MGNSISSAIDWSSSMTEDEVNTRLLNAKDAFTIRRCLGVGAYVDVTNSDGWTALMLAAARDDNKSVDALIKAGANVSAVDGNQFNAVMAAAENGSINYINTLIKAKAPVNINKRNAISFAISSHHWDCVILLIEAGAMDYYSLCEACANDAPAIVIKKMLEDGARTDIKNSEGKTPFDLTNNDEIKELMHSMRKPGWELEVLVAKSLPL